jgi:hypothetical protein
MLSADTENSSGVWAHTLPQDGRQDTVPSVRGHKLERQFTPVKGEYDDLACYRLLASVFEVPEMIELLIGGHGWELQRDLLLSVHVTAADRMLNLENKSPLT